MTDIDWKNSEIYLIQGKTKQALSLPLDENAGNAIIDYILHGRPVSESQFMFLRSFALYQQFHDGVSISCIFRKYLKKAGITHVNGDGKTFHVDSEGRSERKWLHKGYLSRLYLRCLDIVPSNQQNSTFHWTLVD